MRRLTATVAVVVAGMVMAAYSPKRDLKDDIRLSASNYAAYPGPDNDRVLTPAPDSLVPFYISHYGRHGSRFLIDKAEYDEPLGVLQRADTLGKLTTLGRDVLRRVRWMRAEADGRFGELTELGAEQHRDIARRMYERFSEVFDDSSHVDARSTIIIRCILSMENELLELVRLNPDLSVSHDASQHDMYYMNYSDRLRFRRRYSAEARAALDALYNSEVDTMKLMRRIFNDMDYVKSRVAARRLNDRLFRLASTTQNSDARYKVTLYDIFDDDDLYANWRVTNARWYMEYGYCPLNGGTQPLIQRNLLTRIISDADSCIALAHPGASLRFGHETVLLPLVCLMGINGYDLQTTDLAKLGNKGWIDYLVFPMGGNVQLVFYRKDASDRDPLVKVLLNENEARLPIKAVEGPYYRWRDVRDYWLKKMELAGGGSDSVPTDGY